MVQFGAILTMVHQ